MKIEKYGLRNWAVYDNAGVLVCITVYKKGAKEVVRRFEGSEGGCISEADINYLPNIKKLLKEIKHSSKQIQKLANQIEV
ncbi:MAG: hypothetical protein ACOYVK_13795 [Bacillota bacterium]